MNLHKQRYLTAAIIALLLAAISVGMDASMTVCIAWVALWIAVAGWCVWVGNTVGGEL